MKQIHPPLVIIKAAHHIKHFQEPIHFFSALFTVTPIRAAQAVENFIHMGSATLVLITLAISTLHLGEKP